MVRATLRRTGKAPGGYDFQLGGNPDTLTSRWERIDEPSRQGRAAQTPERRGSPEDPHTTHGRMAGRQRRRRTMTARRHVLVWGIAGLGALAVWALGHEVDPLSRLRAGAPLRIGYAVEPPYAFLRPDGTVGGEAPEIARRIAGRLGLPTLDWRQMEFGELLDSLDARQIDVIAAGMFITPERQRRALFSLPTIHVRPGLLVARGNPKRILSYREAAGRADLSVAVLSASVEEQIMRRLGLAEPRLLTVPDALSGRRAVESGLADALALSEPTVRWMARSERLGATEPVVSAAEPGDVYGHTAFAFRRDEAGLLRAWNQALKAYLGSPDHRALLAGLGLAAEPPFAPGPDQ